MRWPEVTAAIAHTIGKKITYESGWENDETKIKIDGIELPTFKENWRNKSDEYKK